MATIPEEDPSAEAQANTYELLRGREETDTEAQAPHADDGSPLPCADCGARPWGYGYGGLYCQRCAPLNMPVN